MTAPARGASPIRAGLAQVNDDVAEGLPGLLRALVIRMLVAAAVAGARGRACAVGVRGEFTIQRRLTPDALEPTTRRDGSGDARLRVG